MSRLNVTREEFRDINVIAHEVECPMDALHEIKMRLGILHTPTPLAGFKVVVRTDVPFIPFDSKGVKRVEVIGDE